MENSLRYPFIRNKYFYGKLLTVKDFDIEQTYFNDKRRLINRLLLGPGVVCGLQVLSPAIDRITLEPGVAMDHSGREIIVREPVVLKINDIKEITEVKKSKNIYVCIAYKEEPKEVVHSMASSSALSEEKTEYNRIQEGYEIRFTDKAPDASVYGPAGLLEHTGVIYEDENVRIWQKSPRYVNPGQVFDISLKIEKAPGLEKVDIDYEIDTQCFYRTDGGRLRIYFLEPGGEAGTEFEKGFPMKAVAVGDQHGEISVKGKRIKLKIGDRVLDVKSDYKADIHVTNIPVREQLLKDYAALSMADCLGAGRQQSIYLAKISLLCINHNSLGYAFTVQSVENVPFDQYTYNMSLLYRLVSLERSLPSSGFTARASAASLDSREEPQASVTYNPKNNEFDFQIGIPQASPPLSATTGVVEFELGDSPRAGKGYFSEEIDHGLGPGQVLIVTGLEELEGITADSGRIFYGDYGVFPKNENEPMLPTVSTGASLYPKKGTFRIGMTLQDPAGQSVVRIRWWAYRNEGTESMAEERPDKVNVLLEHDFVEVNVGGVYRFKADVTGTSNKEVHWRVSDLNGGTEDCGYIDGDGVYVAPAAKGVYRVTAISRANPSRSANTYVMVKE